MVVVKDKTYVERLTSILVKQGTMSQDEAKAVKKAFKEFDQEIFDEFLIDEGLVEEADLLKALGAYYQVPSFDVVGYFFDTFLLHMFPKAFLLRNQIVPLEVDENIMIVVAAEPNASDLLSLIGDHVSYDIRFRVGLTRHICDTVKEFYDKSDVQEQDQDLRKERQLVREELSIEDHAEDVVRHTDDRER